MDIEKEKLEAFFVEVFPGRSNIPVELEIVAAGSLLPSVTFSNGMTYMTESKVLFISLEKLAVRFKNNVFTYGSKDDVIENISEEIVSKFNDLLTLLSQRKNFQIGSCIEL